MPEIARIELDTTLMQQYAQFLRQAPRIAREEMAVSLEEALSLLEREIKENMPVGAHGLLRGSVFHELRGDPGGVAGVVGSPLNYALPVELGTKPHFPPLAPLQDWVEKKLGVDKSESRQVAFLVARKIARKGTAAQHPFEQGLSENSRQVLALIEGALPRIVARLEAGESG
jgi:hypothetical protein